MAHAAFSWSTINNGDIYGGTTCSAYGYFCRRAGCRINPSKREKIPESYEVILVKAKKTLKILAVCLVLAMAVAMSVSAVTYNTVNLSKTMYYVSGAANSFTSDQATYYGHTFATSDYACQIYLFGKTEDGNTGVSSRILDIGESIGSGGTFTASRYGVLSWYAYAQPYGSKSGLGGYCTATAKSL